MMNHFYAELDCFVAFHRWPSP